CATAEAIPSGNTRCPWPSSCSSRGSVVSSAPRPTAESSPCSTAASSRKATAGASSTAFLPPASSTTSARCAASWPDRQVERRLLRGSARFAAQREAGGHHDDDRAHYEEPVRQLLPEPPVEEPGEDRPHVDERPHEGGGGVRVGVRHRELAECGEEPHAEEDHPHRARGGAPLRERRGEAAEGADEREVEDDARGRLGAREAADPDLRDRSQHGGGEADE